MANQWLSTIGRLGVRTAFRRCPIFSGRVSFAFVDCADGKRETVDKAAAWLADNGFAELPAYYDVESEAQYLYRVTSLPTTVVVSASGEVMTVSPGTIDPDTLRSALDSLL